MLGGAQTQHLQRRKELYLAVVKLMHYIYTYTNGCVHQYYRMYIHSEVNVVVQVYYIARYICIYIDVQVCIQVVYV